MCFRDTYSAALSRSVKLEWTPGPRLALIAFLSTSSCCIRVTFPLWGVVPSFMYLSLIFSICAQTLRLRPRSHFTEAPLHGSLQKQPKLSCRGLGRMGRQERNSSHTHTHTPTLLHTDTCGFVSHSDNASWSLLCLSGCSIIYLLPSPVHLGLQRPFIIPEKPCLRYNLKT